MARNVYYADIHFQPAKNHIMRNLLFAIGLASFLTGYGQNQVVSKTHSNKKKLFPSTTFGFKGDYNRSVINGYETSGAKTGYIGGELYGSFFAETRLSETMIFENELLFSWTDDYHFIEIPLHLKLKLAKKWSAFAGPKLDIIADSDNDPSEVRFTFRHFGVSAELGAQFNISRRLFLEILAHCGR